MTLKNRDRVYRLQFMDIISLLLCESPTDRQSELIIWRCIAISAMALVLIGTGPELVSLWLGIAVGLCLRGRAEAGAKAIRGVWRLACGYTRKVIGRVWHAQLFDQTASIIVRLITWLRIFVALCARAFYQPHFGIPLTASPPAR
jgi:hypothetical protein